MAALDNNFLDQIELDNEIRETREQVSHLRDSCAKPWNPQQLEKMGRQLHAAKLHLARLERMRDAA